LTERRKSTENPASATIGRIASAKATAVFPETFPSREDGLLFLPLLQGQSRNAVISNSSTTKFLVDLTGFCQKNENIRFRNFSSSLLLLQSLT
jgi:hypothetical protein